MHLSLGFIASGPNKVCQLRKSFYGLRESPRNWFGKLASALHTYGFSQSHADHTLFTYHQQGIFLVVLVYVDDFILIGNNLKACTSFKHYLNGCFHIKDLGTLKYYLGIKVARCPFDLFLLQCKYVLNILAEASLTASKSTEFVIEQNHTLAIPDNPPSADPSRYRRLVGRLVYLTTTRLDICYVVHILSQFLYEPRQKHLDAVYHILCYLQGIPGNDLFLQADSSLKLSAYYDFDWASYPLTRRSTTEYFIKLGNSLVSWKVKK